MLSVANKPIMLSIIMLNVIMLSVVAPHENYVGEQYLGLYQINILRSSLIKIMKGIVQNPIIMSWLKLRLWELC